MKLSNVWLQTLLIACAAVALAGCWGSAGLAIDSMGSYKGPPVNIAPGNRTYIATFTAPTGGWSAKLDHVRRRFGHDQVFITLTRPPADAAVIQMLVDHAVETRVSNETGIEVFARVVESGVDAGARAYRLAGSATPE